MKKGKHMRTPLAVAKIRHEMSKSKSIENYIDTMAHKKPETTVVISTVGFRLLMCRKKFPKTMLRQEQQPLRRVLQQEPLLQPRPQP